MNGTSHETGVSDCMNKRRLRIIKYVAIAVVVMALAWGASAIAVYAVSSGRVFDSASIDALPRRRAAVVMGCVRTLPNGLNNLYFSRRIDAAAELYKAGKVDCLIVSGDNHVKGYDEPSDMKESLAKAGVPADRIVCDYAGFRTLDTVVRAKKVFGLDSFIIVSQPDHVRRAVFTARGFGCDAYGYAAKDVNGRYSIKTTIREQLAKIAAVLDVILRRSPKFLGPRDEGASAEERKLERRAVSSHGDGAGDLRVSCAWGVPIQPQPVCKGFHGHCHCSKRVCDGVRFRDEWRFAYSRRRG